MIFANNKYEVTGLRRYFGDDLPLGKHQFGSGQINILDKAEDYSFKMPINWGNNIAADPIYDKYLNCNATRPARWLAEFENALVLPPFNLVLFDFSSVFANSVRGRNFLKMYFDFEGGAILSLKKDYKIKVVDEPITVVGTSERRNYCHWITEILPRYLLSSQIVPERTKFAFYDFERPFQAECLADFTHLGHEHIFFNDLNTAYLCKKLYVPSLPSGSMWNFNRDLETYASVAVKDIQANSNRRPCRKIFVSRADASFRRIVNEDTLYTQLREQYGFEKVVLGDLSFQAQKQLFYESSFIISPHGAGMANIIFSQAGTKVLELMPKSHLYMSDFWAIANYLKTIDYYILRSTKNDINLGFGAQKTDFYADIEQVLKLVKQALKSKSQCVAH